MTQEFLPYANEADVLRIGGLEIENQIDRVSMTGDVVVTNDDTREYSAVTVSDLEKMIGVSLLPGLSQKVRDSGMDLPKPSSQRGKKQKSKAQEEFTLRDFSRSVIDAIKRASQH